jgi:hypothetical protein
MASRITVNLLAVYAIVAVERFFGASTPGIVKAVVRRKPG